MPGDAATFQTFSDIIVNSVGVVEVWVIVDSDAAKNSLTAKLLEDGLTQAQIDDHIVFYRWENDAIWMIDYGPLPIVDSNDTVAFMDFRCYHQRVLDDAMPTMLGNAIGTNTYRSPLNLEGGNFQADGEEYCYTTERELYYTGLSEQQLTDVFIEWFGCEKVAILKDISNDGTGHIDMLFKLADKHKAILPWTCVLPPDSMCLIKSYAAACEDGFVCDDATGTCVEEGTGPDEDTTGGGDDGGSGGGSNCTTGASSPMAGGLVLMALLGLAVIRRRVIL